MSLETELNERANHLCELCATPEPEYVTAVNPSDNTVDQSIIVCESCNHQLGNMAELDANHWQCLHTSAWSPVPAVQVMAYRLLKNLTEHSWAQDLLDMLYLEPDVQKWADAGITEAVPTSSTKDSNGTILNEDDSVTLIKDLDVKGAGFTAKRGTLVKNISLTDDPANIEGRVNGVRIVLKTCFLKKA